MPGSGARHAGPGRGAQRCGADAGRLPRARQHRVLCRRSRGRPAPRRAGARRLRAAPPRRSARLYSADPYVLCGYFLAHSLLRLGYPEQGREHAKALARARELAHAVTLANAVHHDCLFHQLDRNPLAVREQSEFLITFATEHSLPFWQALGEIFHGWASAGSGRLAVGIAELQRGLAAYRATSGRLYLPYTLDAARGPPPPDRRAGRRPCGARRGAPGDRRDRNSRLRGAGASDRSPAAAGRARARARRRRALPAPRDDRRARPGARLSELRAALQLGELWRDQGRQAEAYDLVAPLYTWFNEGRDSADLREAATLLGQLA